MASNQAPGGKTPSSFLQSDELKKLFVQFVLTSILGGGLTMYWQHRNTVRAEGEQLRSNEIRAATDAFNEISRLLDRRLYRTRQVFWGEHGRTSGFRTEERRKAYMDAVGEWNEALNRNYAMTERYFGSSMRVRLERSIAEDFRCISELLISPRSSARDVEARLDALNVAIYEFNLQMLTQIQNGTVGALRKGVREPSPDPGPSLSCPVLPASISDDVPAEEGAKPARRRTR